MKNSILKFISRNIFTRFVSGFIIIFVSGIIIGSLVITPAKNIYYASVDGTSILNVKSVDAQKTVAKEDRLTVGFCRDPSERVIAVNNIRTFYQDENGMSIRVLQRTLPDGISYEHVEGGCTFITIKPSQRPNEVGTYHFCQELDFDLYGHKKTARFCSSGYTIYDNGTIK